MFFDRPGAGDRALLVHCALSSAPVDFSIETSSHKDDPAPEVSEFVDLVRSAGVSPVYLELARRNTPTANFFIGSGKVAELHRIVHAHDIEIVIFNHALSPSQERNLEKELQCRVLDRTGLILDIFAQRARSHVGKLQVELAQLEHISTRLVRGWTHLERQKGGIGLRGPGESQLETDRRLLRERVKWLNRRLARVNAQQKQSKRSRRRADLPTITLVGYTNAGKSTLFNALTESDVYAQDQLFATLDTTLRRLSLPGYGNVVLADTVGFVRDLPHKLVEAFKATLEEAAEADLLLHVVDAASFDREEQIAACEDVLREIGAADVPSILVMNKIDALEPQLPPRLDLRDEQPEKVWISAHQGQGLDLLGDAIVRALGRAIWSGEVQIPVGHARLRAELYAMGAVQNERSGEEGDYLLTLSYRTDALVRCFAIHKFEVAWN